MRIDASVNLLHHTVAGLTNVLNQPLGSSLDLSRQRSSSFGSLFLVALMRPGYTAYSQEHTIFFS